jgi:hypothetical protein
VGPNVTVPDPVIVSVSWIAVVVVSARLVTVTLGPTLDAAIFTPLKVASALILAAIFAATVVYCVLAVLLATSEVDTV